MFMQNVPHKEIDHRRELLRRSAQELGLKGVIVCSRGGGTFDRYAGGVYYANHYQQRCFLPDNLPLWSGRSHSLLLIPSEGEAVLLATTLEFRRDLVSIDDVRYGDDFYTLFRETAREKGMDRGRVGIIGEDVLPLRTYRLLLEQLADIHLLPCDDLFEKARTIKSRREIKAIETASAIGSRAVEIIMENVAAGKTESEIVAPGIAYCIEQGASLYFVVSSSGPHSDAVHSIDFPGYDSLRKLQPGELFKVDLIITYEGYISDFGRTTVVGGKPSPLQRMMIETVTDACEAVIEAVHPGTSVSELVALGDTFLRERGVSLSSVQNEPGTVYAAFPPHWGHGIGLTWEQPWFVESEGSELQAGMYLAVEKALFSPEIGTVTYEQNLLVTDAGCRTLSTTKKLWI